MTPIIETEIRIKRLKLRRTGLLSFLSLSALFIAAPISSIAPQLLIPGLVNISSIARGDIKSDGVRQDDADVVKVYVR
jgi:hypothetical protein